MSDIVEILAFGRFTMDLRRRALRFDGKPVALHPRAFDLLECLVANRERVISRDEIVERVWRGAAVSENNLTVQLSTLRRVLGEHGADGLIITLPGRGYRFVDDVTDALAEPASTPPPAPPPRPIPDVSPPIAVRRWRFILVVAAAAVLAGLAGLLVLSRGRPPAPPRLSIVVMPLRDLSGHADDAYLADAITDDLTTDLAHIPGSLVIARETADTFRARTLTAEAIGRKLHVRYLLEGSLRAETAALHVNVQLIDTTSGAHLWAERFDVARDKLGEARDMIVSRIGDRLNAELDHLEATRGEHDRPGDADALDLFFRARSTTDHDDTLLGYDTAQALLERALAKQPNFADAHAELADMLIRKVRSTDDPKAQADLAEAGAAITRALSLSPRNAVALAAQAHLRFVENRLTDARYSAKAALDSDPGNLEAQDVLAGCALADNRLPEATAALEALVERNPAGVVAKQRLLRLGNLLLLQGRPGEAADRLNAAIAGDPDPRPGGDDWGRAEGARTLLIAATGLAGRLPEARAMYANFERVWPRRSTWRLAGNATRSMSSLPGFGRMLGALETAGMPRYADEHVDDHVPLGAALQPDRAFAPTPISIPGGETIDTATLATWLRLKRDPLILDLGHHVNVIPGARWQDEIAQDDASFVDSSLRGVAKTGAGRKIVIMSDGTYGSAAYNAARRLIKAGWANIVWYRGGEEAWAKAGFPAVDRRR